MPKGFVLGMSGFFVVLKVRFNAETLGRGETLKGFAWTLSATVPPC